MNIYDVNEIIGPKEDYWVCKLNCIDVNFFIEEYSQSEEISYANEKCSLLEVVM